MRAVVFLMCLTTIIFISAVNTRSPPVCEYVSLNGYPEDLSYFRDVKKSEKFVDYGSNNDGACLQRATCLDNYRVKVEKCADFNVSCDNKSSFKGEFPACCVQC